MSTANTCFVDVRILDREFRVACPPDERTELLDAVAYLDQKMREIRETGKVASIERIAIMAALNITHELLTLRLGGLDLAALKHRTQAMEKMIDAALAGQDELF